MVQVPYSKGKLGGGIKVVTTTFISFVVIFITIGIFFITIGVLKNTPRLLLNKAGLISIEYIPCSCRKQTFAENSSKSWKV